MAEFIVAIELGSSKITGIAGRKNLDGTMTVLALVVEDASQCIRKGVVNNIDKTAQSLTTIVGKLKKQLKHEIVHVYVGVGGQSIRSVKNVIVKNLPAETIITSDMINELMDANRNMTYPEQEILDAAMQEYKVDKQLTLDPVGMKGCHIEGNFLNILGRKSFYDNLNNCFEKAGIAIAEMYLSPLALADSVLTEAEKRGGCALIDLGADTTTVAVYHKNVLRHLAVIPLGGNNITKDIANLQMEEADAEKMKLKYASAFTDGSDVDIRINYSIDSERSVESLKFAEVVEARVQEIVENALYQIPSEYVSKLLGGLIITGGGANLKNIEQAFRSRTRIEKIRNAKFVIQTVTSTNSEINAKDGTMNTLLGLMAKGDINCAGNEVVLSPNLFDENSSTPSNPSTLHQNTRKSNEIEPGVVQTAAEKEVERRRREEERKHEDEEAGQLQHEEAEKRKNSFWGKLSRKIKDFSGSMLEPED